MPLKIRMEKSRIPLFTALFLLMGLPVLAATAPAGDEAWRQELLKERELKDVEFKTSATSPMAGSARLTITAPGKTFITVLAGIVSAAAQPSTGKVFSVFSREGKWFWADAAPGITCRLGEHDVTQSIEALPAGSLFRCGGFTLAVYPGPDTLALIVFDPQRSQVLHFGHLLYFPPDRRYEVKARLERFPEKKAVKITTTRKLEKTFYRYAKVHFQLDGRELELTALKSSLEGPDAGALFIPFKDATNGGETYEVGRFIDAEEPAGDEFVLDFNRCYNPLCNYSPAYNCPLPPLENILDVSIPAGEKTYPHYKE